MPFLATVVAHVSLLGLALGTCRGTLSRLVFLVPLVGFVSSFTFAFSFVSFGLSFVSFALLPFLASSFVTLVALPGTKRVEVPVVVLLLEGKDTELLVVELQALQHCIQTTGGLVQQKVPFSVLVQVLQDSQNGFLLVHLQLGVLLSHLRLKLHELSHVPPHHIKRSLEVLRRVKVDHLFPQSLAFHPRANRELSVKQAPELVSSTRTFLSNLDQVDEVLCSLKLAQTLTKQEPKLAGPRSLTNVQSTLLYWDCALL